MGLTIFARGRIDSLEAIARLIDEIKGIAEERNWTYTTINDCFEVQPNAVVVHSDVDEPAAIEGSLGLKGIIVSVDPKAEPLTVLFDRSGVLTDMMQQIHWISDNVQDERFTACKTQFGNIDSHIYIIELLDVLKKRYVTDLVVDDEGEYWENRDPKLLAEKRAVLEHYMHHTEGVIRGTVISDHDAQKPENVASRITEALLDAEEEDGPHH